MRLNSLSWAGSGHMELNTCGVYASSDVPTYRKNSGRKKTELNACEIHVSSGVPTYIKVQKSVHIYTYKYYFNCKIMRKNCLSVGWVWGKRFLLDVSVKRLHDIHMTLKDCIGFRESKHPSIISPIRYVQERITIFELISTVYNQHKILVLNNANIIVKHQTWYDLRVMITWRWPDLLLRSNKLFKNYALTSDDSSFKKNSLIIRSQRNILIVSH